MLSAVRQYSLPLLLALVLHGFAAMALYANWNPSSAEARVIEPPKAVQASLLMLEPPPAPPARPQPQPEPQPQQPPAQQPEPKPEPKPEPAEPQPDPEAQRRREEQARLEAQREAEEAARRAAEERARQERLQALSRTAFEEALQSEASDLAETEAAADEALAMSYQRGIYEAVVANWSRPPSARNRMEAKLMVELVPTGDVVSVTVLESSGNAAFDRSAEAAVRKADRFEVPKDPDVFEEHFRRFTLLFRPEDLLR